MSWIKSADGVDMSEPADRTLAVVGEHYKRVEAERDALKAQVAELRSALQAMIKGRVSERLPNAVHPSGRFCHVCGCNSTVQVHSHGCPVKLAEEVLASPKKFATGFGDVFRGNNTEIYPGEELLAKARTSSGRSPASCLGMAARTGMKCERCKALGE